MEISESITATPNDRIRFLLDNGRRMFRTGAQFAIGALGQDLTQIDAFQASWASLLGAFGGGCLVWVLTTLAAPPKE